MAIKAGTPAKKAKIRHWQRHGLASIGMGGLAKGENGPSEALEVFTHPLGLPPYIVRAFVFLSPLRDKPGHTQCQPHKTERHTTGTKASTHRTTTERINTSGSAAHRERINALDPSPVLQLLLLLLLLHRHQLRGGLAFLLLPLPLLPLVQRRPPDAQP